MGSCTWAEIRIGLKEARSSQIKARVAAITHLGCSSRRLMALLLLSASAASSIASLLENYDAIIDIGLEDDAICDSGAKMLVDALKHNSMLQTLKLQDNNIQTEPTLKTIIEMPKKNKDSSKVRFEKDHPE